MNTHRLWVMAIEGGDTDTIRKMAPTHLRALSDEDPVSLALFAQQPTSVNTLIELGAKIKEDLVMAAARMGYAKTLDILLNAGVSPDYQDNHGDCALMMAARNGHDECVATLLSRGANPDLPDKQGQTALHHAIIDGNETVCERLGGVVDIQTVDKIGWNYLMYAAIQQRRSLCFLLMERGVTLAEQAPDGRTIAQLTSPDFLDVLVRWKRAYDQRNALTTLAQDVNHPAQEAIRKKPGM